LILVSRWRGIGRLSRLMRDGRVPLILASSLDHHLTFDLIDAVKLLSPDRPLHAQCPTTSDQPDRQHLVNDIGGRYPDAYRAYTACRRVAA
jgi:hypothetical protein